MSFREVFVLLEEKRLVGRKKVTEAEPI